MRGNIGVHFEDVGYAVTNMKQYLYNLSNAGYSKVVATGLGNFTQYEDLHDIIKKIRKDEDPEFQMDIIPGIQCYFKDTNNLLTLIAKDYEGYQSLCKIITESNALGTIIEDKKNNNNKPIVHLDNLKKYVSKGHLYVTTSGKNGAICNLLSGEVQKLEKEIEELEESLNHFNIAGFEDVSFETAKEVVDYYNAEVNVKRPLKKEFAIAEEYYKSTGNRSDLEELEKQQVAYEHAQKMKNLIGDQIKALEKGIKPYERSYYFLLDRKAKLKSLQESSKEEEAIQLYKELEDIFGKDNFYFELQYHNDELEKSTMNQLIHFAYQVQGEHPNFIVGNDTRLGVSTKDEELESEMIRLQIADFKNNGEYKELDKNIKEYCIKTEEELKDALEQCIEHSKKDQIIETAIQNVDKLINECQMNQQNKDNHYPQFCEDENAEFERLCKKGIAWRFPNGFTKEYEERLEKELQVIQTMGYAGYHLIVQDYLNYARLLGYLNESEVENAPLTIDELEKYLTDNNIERIGSGIGPGRGSAAGSLCCYLLGITDIDPIKNGLLFERFLNPERVSMPDIDSDFRPQVRLKAREYVRHKYGEENVCEIVTKAYEGEKGAIHDVARFLGTKYGLNLSDEDAKAIKSQWDRVGDQLAKKYDEYNKTGDLKLSKFYEAIKEECDAKEHEIFQYAPKILGMFTGYSQHAAGVIISKDCISDHIPLMWNSTAQSLQTQCQMAQAENRGYLKMDFLGLRNLAIITDTTKNPSNPKDKTDICQDAVKREKEVLNNQNVIKTVFCRGLTQGVFQFESEGMKQMLVNFQPESFEDIVLLVAAYRPGPLSYIPEMIAQKWYQKDPEHYFERVSKFYPPDERDKEGKLKYAKLYPTPQSTIATKNDTLTNILKATYGCPIYQEQIMQIFQEMAGYSLGRADEVRRAMSKKKEDILLKEKENFIYGNEKEIEQAKEKLEQLKIKCLTVSESERINIQKEIDNFKIPAQIDGCMKRQGLTEKEADTLFEGMIDFAKYGFNKSHAAAYAVVAMQTAWLKTYRTKDFYCAALNNWKEMKEVPKYAKEMQTFGIKFLPPTLDYKGSEFRVEGNDIRFPIAKAKNVANKGLDVTNDNTLYGFIKHNPKISETQIKTLIKLGCFDSCWNFSTPNGKQQEINRVNGSKHILLNWLSKYYKDVQKMTNNELDLKEKELTVEQIEKKEEENRKIKDSFLQVVKTPGYFKTYIPNTLEKLEERKWEYELTNHYFNISDDLKKIQEYENKNTYKDLQTENRGGKPIPCVILSVSDKKHTKTGIPFYDATLMDRDGTIFIRRLKDKPVHSCGIFNLYPDCQRYFSSEATPVKDMPTQEKQQTNIETMIKDLTDGKDVSYEIPTKEEERGDYF